MLVHFTQNVGEARESDGFVTGKSKLGVVIVQANQLVRPLQLLSQLRDLTRLVFKDNKTVRCRSLVDQARARDPHHEAIDPKTAHNNVMVVIGNQEVSPQHQLIVQTEIEVTHLQQPSDD